MPPDRTAAVLSIGQELVLGRIADTNAAHIAARLHEAGWPVREVRAVGDDADRIARAFLDLADRHAVVVSTGGLGPTADDLTRRALAEAAGVALHEDARSLALIEERFRAMQRPMADANRVQALLPEGARPVRNPVGTAPGIEMQLGGGRVYALPGVPREMRRLLADHVLGAIGRGPAGVVRMRELHLADIGESTAGEALADLMTRGRTPDVGTGVRDGVLTVRIVAAAETASAADAALAADAAEVRRRLGARVYGEDEESLPGAVVRRFTEAGRTLATAESCTGGLVAKWITDVPGSSAVFREGFVVYHNGAKTDRLGVPERLLAERGAVSEPVARALAEGARRVAGVDHAVGITGVAGPGGGTEEKPVGLVHLAAAGPGGTDHRVLCGPHDRAGNRRRAAVQALVMLLEQLDAAGGPPGPGTGEPTCPPTNRRSG